MSRARAHPAVLARATTLWPTLVGATSLEVFGRYGETTFAEPRRLLEHHIVSAPVERASSTDLAFLAMDAGTVPEQFGVLLRLGPGCDLGIDRVRALLAARVGAVPRLRQRLQPTPLGCGGPVWVDHAQFDVCRHVREVASQPPGDEEGLLDTALTLLTTRLSRQEPLWALSLVTGLADESAALVLVVHHVLADGLGGVTILAALLDDGEPADDGGFPRPPPAPAELAREAWHRRVRVLGTARGSWQLLRAAMTAGGGWRPPPVSQCSLLVRTGPRRRMAVVRVDRTELRGAAHRVGATTNDALLVAIATALAGVLRTRGEAVDPIVITVPVSGRAQEPPGRGRAASARRLGNMVSPLLVPVPTTGGLADRLRAVATHVRATRTLATGPPPIALLGWAFRPLARLGGFRWYMNHQHRLHTLVTHVRGPADHVTFGGVPVQDVAALAVGESGNTTVNFGVLSYADALSVTAIVDPDHFPELDALAAGLAHELAAISELAGGL
ncbi:MAG: wax ester/triacylglycerol synthase domain-containing protein [Dermatophilaceae bacterium]